jgi:hypothetical protein
MRRLRLGLLTSIVALGLIYSAVGTPRVQAAATLRVQAAATNGGRYQVNGGFISGALTKINSLAQFQGKDTHYLFDPSLITLSMSGPQYFVVQGAPYQGQWTYPYQVSPDVGSGVFTLSVAIDSTNHTQLIATGAPTQRVLQTFHSAQTPNQQIANCPSVPGRGVVGPDCYTRTRYLSTDTFWYDPAGIHVNEVYTEMTCDEYQTPSYVNCSAWDSTSWYQPSGWYQVSHSFSLYYYNSQTWAESDSYAHFRDPNFPACLGNWTDTYYQPNWVRDSAWDSYSGSVNTWVASSAQQCVWLLHYSTWTSAQ